MPNAAPVQGMDPEYVDAMIESLQCAADRGDWAAVKRRLGELAPVRKTADERLVKRLADWDRKLKAAKEHEAVQGSLFDPRHPGNIEIAELAAELREARPIIPLKL